MRALVAILTVGAAHASAQSPLYDLLPDSDLDVYGWSATGLGDADGDGVDDFAVGARRDAPPGLAPMIRVGSTTVYSGASGVSIAKYYGDVDGEAYGHRIAGPGDVDGDGRADVLIGNPGFDGGRGEADVRSVATGAIVFSFPGDAPGDAAGMDVAGAGDVNGDGTVDLLVGARLAEPPGAPADQDVGSATLRSGLDGSVLLRWYGDTPSDSLGLSVAGVGDVDLDGFPDVAAGAPQCNSVFTACPRTGYARVFSGRNGTLLFQVDGTADGDELGISLAPAGDPNLDGRPDFVVGAWRAGATGTRSGSARLCSGVDGSALFEWHGDGAYDQFGFELDGGRDIDGDGVSDLLVGAPEICGPVVDPACPSPGYARVLSGADGSVVFSAAGVADEDHFGMAVAFAGDVNTDGRDDFLIGARYSDLAGTFSGSAHVFSGHTLELLSDAHELSLASGGSAAFALRPGAAFAGQPFLLLGTTSGTAPGIPIGSVLVPLNVDAYLLHTLGSPGSPPLVGALGVLDAIGQATASFALPAGSSPALAGVLAHHAFCVFDAATGDVRSASNAVPLTLLP